MIQSSLPASLQNALPTAFTSEQVEMIERAYAVASYWHRGQKRHSGDPYISHPVAVAVILAELGQDHQMLSAALLHDLLEDTDCPESLLREEFGDEVVDPLRALHKFDYDAPSSAGPRTLTLKLADRLHNLRTAEFLPAHKARRKAQETLEVFIPLAEQLKLEGIRQELEVLARAWWQGTGSDGIGFAYQAISTGAILLPSPARDRYLEEWLSDLHTLSGRRARTRFTIQLLAGMPRMATVLRKPGLKLPTRVAAWGRRLLYATWWLVRSDLRVWTLLTPLLIWMVLDTATDGLGDALALLITVPPVLDAGVEWLRPRIRNAVARHKHPK